MLMTTPASAGQPTLPQQRFSSMDVLRGFALFGILLVNMFEFIAEPAGWVAGITASLVTFFAEDNFYPLFSLLFGAGFAVQMMRASAKGSSGVGRYLRRVGGLFVIACLFFVFLEDRHILLRYALLALPLLAFRSASPRILLICAAACIPLAAYGGDINRSIERARVAGLTEEELAERQAARDVRRERERGTWQAAVESGAYIDFARHRAVKLPALLENLIFRFWGSLPHIFAAFLLGVYAVRRRLFQEPEANKELLWRLAGVGVIIGVLGESIVAFRIPTEVLGLPPAPIPGRPFRILVLMGYISLSVAYGASLLLLMQHERWRERLSNWLAPAGRMALTNYMMQSVFMTWLFLPHGLGLEERVPPLGMVGLVALLFSLQAAASRWWLARFRFGPAEWAWRTATYLRVQPMRAVSGSPPAHAGTV